MPGVPAAKRAIPLPPKSAAISAATTTSISALIEPVSISCAVSRERDEVCMLSSSGRRSEVRGSSYSSQIGSVSRSICGRRRAIHSATAGRRHSLSSSPRIISCTRSVRAALMSSMVRSEPCFQHSKVLGATSVISLSTSGPLTPSNSAGSSLMTRSSSSSDWIRRETASLKPWVFWSMRSAWHSPRAMAYSGSRPRSTCAPGNTSRQCTSRKPIRDAPPVRSTVSGSRSRSSSWARRSERT